MSNDEVTQNKPAADGTDSPAAGALCLCGTRGCPKSKAHRRQMGMTGRTRRRHGV